MKIQISVRKRIGEYWKDLRLRNGLTQIQVAKLLGYESPRAISALERGLADLPDEALIKIAKIYGVDIENFREVYTKAIEDSLNRLVLGQNKK